jgi:hypothetical protein
MTTNSKVSFPEDIRKLRAEVERKHGKTPEQPSEQVLRTGRNESRNLRSPGAGCGGDGDQIIKTIGKWIRRACYNN